MPTCRLAVKATWGAAAELPGKQAEVQHDVPLIACSVPRAFNSRKYPLFN